MNTKRTLSATAFAGIALVTAMAASAATTITVDSVVQRWPWNNKVDITYTVGGGQNLAAGEYKKIVFTATINGTAYTIDGTTDVGASANAGTHTVTWTAPSGIRCTDCTMSAAVYASDGPSGNDYMIVDLTKTSNNVTYEGLLASQDASNARYNVDAYKKDKLVLRKVPAGGPYPTGDSSRYSTGNASGSWPNNTATWTTDRDYYICVFPVTQYQYTKLYGSNPSQFQGNNTPGNPAALRPVEQVTYDDLRLSTTDPASPIPAVTSNSGTFLQRLNFITGNKFGFDLPTEVMFEIASRAGSQTAYPWGNSMVTNYVVCSGNAGGITVAVGSRLPNSWGLYDMTGNTFELLLDALVAGDDQALRADAFTPKTGSRTMCAYRGGAYYHASNNAYFYASYRLGTDPSKTFNGLGFRVAMVAD